MLNARRQARPAASPARITESASSSSAALFSEPDELAFLLVLDIADQFEGVVQHTDSGASARKPMHVDAFLVPGTERAGEGHDGEAPPEHASGQHRGLRHADDRNIEQFARPEETRITEGGDDGGIAVAMALRQHLERNRPADLGLGSGCDIGDATRRRCGRDDRACPPRLAWPLRRAWR